MKITIYRGNQIGGCITAIESSKGTKIFIDLGHNLPSGDEEAPDEYASFEAIAELTKGAKAFFYTHIHGDHIELFKYVPEGIDQYVGPLAHKLMVAKYKQMTYANELKDNSLLCLKKLEPFKKYHKGWNITVDDIVVTPFQVSHSASDSYMLKVKCDGKTVLHTGDFRGHGYMGEGIYKVIDKFHISGHVDVLITEGTNIDNKGKSMKHERELKQEFMDLFYKYKNTFILCSSTDADRLESIYSADKEGSKRPFIVDTYQKELLQIISEHAEEGRQLYHFGRQKIYSYDPKNWKMEYMMKKCGFVMLIRNTSKFQGYLDKILEFCKPEETSLVYSMFHGYIDNTEGNPAFNPSTFRFVQQFRERGCAIEERAHTSGHASRQDLIRLCQQVNPDIIIPIHKDERADFWRILPNELRQKVCTDRYEKDGMEIIYSINSRTNNR